MRIVGTFLGGLGFGCLATWMVRRLLERRIAARAPAPAVNPVVEPLDGEWAVSSMHAVLTGGTQAAAVHEAARQSGKALSTRRSKDEAEHNLRVQISYLRGRFQHMGEYLPQDLQDKLLDLEEIAAFLMRRNARPEMVIELIEAVADPFIKYMEDQVVASPEDIADRMQMALAGMTGTDGSPSLAVLQ